MKVVCLIITLFIQITCLSQTGILDSVEKIYQFKKANGYSDIIVIYDTTLNNGMYMGVELAKDGTPIYYRSVFLFSKLGHYDLTFQINSYQFSKKPFYINQYSSDYFPKAEKLPYILQHPLKYLGEFKEGKLMIQRITANHLFSSADSMSFIEVDSFPEN